jgi:phosphoribosylaminoimidazole-succinocarboxamide synthase
MIRFSPYLRSGKVRDLYAVGDDRLLLVASDRLSAFDVVMPTLVPDKGRVLTGLSRFWFEKTAPIVPNHLLSTRLSDVPVQDWPWQASGTGSNAWTGEAIRPDVAREDAKRREIELDARGRVMVCRQAEVLPIEVVVRGYLAGSGWKEYRQTGRVCGIDLPAGLRESDRLPEPILTPATKAEAGAHDENIDFDGMIAALETVFIDPDRPLSLAEATELARRVRGIALELYRFAAAQCESVGLILADTKFEFGLVDGELILIDEALTPDSSRFWDAATYEPGGSQSSFDKQFVRDWLEQQPWDKSWPGPELPPDVVAGTRARYVQAFERITGASFERYLGEDVIGP